MNFGTIRMRWATACCCAAVVGTSAIFVPAFGEPPMAGGGMMNKPMTQTSEKMMGDTMAMMKDAMKDDNGKMKMTEDLSKMMVMQKMAMEMCADEKCKMMMTDPAMVKVIADAKKMATDADKMTMMRDAMMKDPEAMRQISMMSMSHSAMMNEMPMNGMGGEKTESGKMDGGMKPAPMPK